MLQWSVGKELDVRPAEGLLHLKAHLVILPSDIIWANERCTPLCKCSVLGYSDYHNTALNVEDNKDFQGDHSERIWKNCPSLKKTKPSLESSLKRGGKLLDTFFTSLQPDSVLSFMLYTAIANL